MRRLRAIAILTAGLGIALAGCSPQFEQIETAVDRNGGEIARMRDDQRLIRQELEAISRLLQADDGSDATQIVRVQTRLAQLDRKVDELLGLQEDNAEFMRGLSARVDLLATRLGVPTLGEYKTVDDGADDAGLDVLPEEGQSLFDAAVLDRTRGNDQLAREAFDDFLSMYPRSELADQAHYWLGELAWAAGDHAVALDHFNTVVNGHEGADMRADAMFKIVACHQALNDRDAAWAALDRLQNDYPGSEQAALAAAALDGTE